MKWNILRRFAAHGCEVTVYPASTPASTLLASKPDGVFFSNGPGDPAVLDYAIANAKATVAAGGLDELVWSFVGGVPIVNGRRTVAEVPSETVESRALSKELKRRGFRFVGPTICYAFMQACGLVDDHTTDCFRYSGRG